MKQSIIIFLSVLSIQLLAQPEGEILGGYEDWPSEVIEKYVVTTNCGGNLEREVNVRITRKPYSEQGVSGKWYDTYISVDMCPDLLFTKQLKFRYKIALDLMVTMDIWREGWITWEEDLKEIGKEFYLGRAGNGYYKLELELVCNDNPSEEKKALFSNNNMGVAAKATETQTSTLLVKSEADCILKIDFEEVAQLKAGEGKRITIEAGEHIIEAYNRNNEAIYEKDLFIKIGEQQVLRITNADYKTKGESVNNSNEYILLGKFTYKIKENNFFGESEKVQTQEITSFNEDLQKDKKRFNIDSKVGDSWVDYIDSNKSQIQIIGIEDELEIEGKLFYNVIVVEGKMKSSSVKLIYSKGIGLIFMEMNYGDNGTTKIFLIDYELY